MNELSCALARYRDGEPRNVVFRDLVLDSIRKFPPHSTAVLDIGCGHGFDGNRDLQRSIATETAQFIGIEPDRGITPPEYFTVVHNTIFENAPVVAQSIHLAYSAFVLEHVEYPQHFWEKVYDSLIDGGVFWGFTVDRRHPFALASGALDMLRLKNSYLDRLRGQRGTERYENYPTFYRANTPRQIRQHSRMFGSAQFLSMHRVGQLNYYFPQWARRMVNIAERMSMGLNFPGSMLVVRLEKMIAGRAHAP